LYIKLLEYDEKLSKFCSNVEEAMSILLETAWGEANSRNNRNEVADSLGIQLSTKVRNGTKSSKKNARNSPRDEFASYMSLVKDTGR